MLLRPEAVALISAGISKAVEKNKNAISLRDTIVLAGHMYLESLKKALESSKDDGMDTDTTETFSIARDALQELVGVFGITVDLETMKNEGAANDNNKVQSNTDGQTDQNVQ